MTTKSFENQNAFTLIELLIVIAIFAFFASMLPIAGPKQKGKARRISCVNNLKQVGLGFQVWAREHDGSYPMMVADTNGGAMESVLSGKVAAVFQVMSNELNSPKLLYCPADEKRIQANVFDVIASRSSPNAIPFLSNTNVSYFVGLDASAAYPEMFLTGDDNFLISGRSDNLPSGLPATPGLLTFKSNSLIAWSKARHEKQGNVGLADGSVQQFSSRALQRAWEHVAAETNRLMFP